LKPKEILRNVKGLIMEKCVAYMAIEKEITSDGTQA
jgi:hypothetical protein